MPTSVIRRILALVLRIVWRVRVVGLEHVPQHGAVVLASNHRSFFDSLVIPGTVPRRVVFLAKAEYFEGRGIRGLLTRTWFSGIGMVPVRRGSHSEAMASLHVALGVLRGGDAFGIYPEGTRSRDGWLHRGRTGVAWLALASGAPVVPVGLVGTQDVQAIGSRVPRIARITVRFGTAIDPGRYMALPAGAARRQLTDDLMQAIAELCEQPLSGEYAPPAA